MDDTIVARAQFLLRIVRDVPEIAGDKQLIADLARGAARYADKLAVLLGTEPHGAFHKVHSYGDRRPAHLVD